MSFFIVNFNSNINEKILVNKIKNKLKKYKFCLLKKFNNSNTQMKLFNIYKKRFLNSKDIRVSGNYYYKMKDYKRLDIGDSYKNPRFSRFLVFMEWHKENDEFFKLINPAIRVRNLVCGIKKENFFYLNLKSAKPSTKNISNYRYCDFVRISQYPTGGGFLSKHHDYDKYYAKEVINVMLPITVRKNNNKNRKLCGFEKGGFYFSYGEKKINIENNIETGDLLLFDTKIHHGVNSIDSHKKLNLDSFKGRVGVVFSIAKFLI